MSITYFLDFSPEEAFCYLLWWLHCSSLPGLLLASVIIDPEVSCRAAGPIFMEVRIIFSIQNLLAICVDGISPIVTLRFCAKKKLFFFFFFFSSAMARIGSASLLSPGLLPTSSWSLVQSVL